MNLVSIGSGFLGSSFTSVEGPSGSMTGEISGEMRLAGSPITGSLGSVEIWNNAESILLAESGINSSGVFTFTNAQPHTTYKLWPQPPLRYCIKTDEEQGFISITTDANGNATRNIDVEDVWWRDDFQYTDTTDLKTNFPQFDATVGSPSGSFGETSQITLDATGGPSSSAAMKYAFPDRGTAGSYTLRARIDLPGGQDIAVGVGGTYWTRLMCKESSGFKNGYTGQASPSYKYGAQLQGIVANAGLDQMGLFLNGVSNKLAADFNLGTQGSETLFISSVANNKFHTYNGVLNNAAFHSYVQRGGPENYTPPPDVDAVNVYVDSVKSAGLFLRTGTGLSGEPDDIGEGNSEGWTAINIGANINGGPDQAQDRWIREVSASPGRPSTRTGIADVSLSVPVAIP